MLELPKNAIVIDEGSLVSEKAILLKRGMRLSHTHQILVCLLSA